MSTKSDSNFEIVNIQPTPNPHALKFILNQPVISGGTKFITGEDDFENDEFVQALFASVPGVESVYINENFVTVTKSFNEDWSELEDEVQQLLHSRLQFYNVPKQNQTNIPENKNSIANSITPEEYHSRNDAEKLLIVEAIFDEQIRPALAADGGGLSVATVEGKIVRINYEGACGSCPSSLSGTLRAIESILRNALGPEIEVFAN